jgi:hypothetical protein
MVEGILIWAVLSIIALLVWARLEPQTDTEDAAA